MAALSLAFDILARDRSASRTFDKVGDAADRAGKKGKTFGSLMKGAAGIAAGAFAAAGIAELIGKGTQALSDSIAEGREAQKAGRTTAAIIKATGGAAKISQKGVEDLAGALSAKAGIDDEVIQSGANLLLTFKNVRNEAGKGAKIFDRATAAAVDLSAAGFGDVAGASKMLGKALNDPLKGISALGRAGVTFTADQKEQIKTLVESGDVLGAQKVILGEVEAQVGGVAAANASMGDKVKVAFGNIKESIGTALLPILDKLGAWFLEKGGPAIQRFAEKALPKVISGLMWLKDAALGLFSLFVKGDFTESFREAFNLEEDSKVTDVLFRIREGFIAVVGFVREKVIPAIQSFWGWISHDLWPALKEGYQTIVPAFKQAFAIVAGAFKSSGGEGSSFGEKLKTVGDIIVTKVIPFVAKLMSVYLPYLATNIRVAIEVVQKLYGAFQTWRSIVSSVISFVLKRFADLAGMWASVLHALGKVPGFGWATDAAKKLDTAAGKANDVARAIDNIERDVKIQVQFKATSGRISVGGQSVNVGMRATGGPVSTGRLYAVGDNPDGSWNDTTELLRPSAPARVVNQAEMRKALGVEEAPSGAAVTERRWLKPLNLTLDKRVVAQVVMDEAGNMYSGGGWD